MDINKVLFISQQIAPYVEDNQMSTTSSDLAQGVKEKGIEVRTFMPKYGAINERRNQVHEVKRLSGINLIIDDTDHPLIIKVSTLQPSRMSVYFIYNDDYFNKVVTKDLETESDLEQNDERSIFFVRGALETVKVLRWMPDVVVCSGWVSALAPLYIKKRYSDDPSFRDTKVVYALYDNEPLEPLGEGLWKKLKFDRFSDKALKPLLNKRADIKVLTQLALNHCDAVVQCSPNIRPELMEMVEQSGLPFLPYDPAVEGDSQAFVERNLEFYRSLDAPAE
ncbi:MAG: glycogen/starch synthase [Muribaculaceae bacterium]|nr:glycogen/starch synthase [Muribaculaceae bacterium]